jgi:hypothetical protein
MDTADREAYDTMLREALALPVGDTRRQELARLCRCGVYRPTPTDWPEFAATAWFDGIFYLRGKARGLAVGDRICADRENFARLYEITTLGEKQVEAEDYEETGKMEWTTKIHVKAVCIGDSYDVLPGSENEDIQDRIIWAWSLAEDTIRRIH